MGTDDISPLVKERAPLILAEIKKATSILLHCHPSPDPDSVGSALAMKLALEQMGKKATVIKGDSEIPQAFMHFPGAKDIVQRAFFEVDLKEFDLFIVLDSSVSTGISRIEKVTIPAAFAVINIDHHRTNADSGFLSLVDPSYPANCQILFDLFTEWGVTITPDIASNLFIGMYTDTGGFRYEGTTPHTFNIAAQLVRQVPGFSKLISDMENSNTPATMAFRGAALDSVEAFLNGDLAIAAVPYSLLKDKNIPPEEVSAGEISSILRSVKDWNVVAALIEGEPDKIKISFRSKDSAKYDVSKLAVALGGGGHKAAAGALLSMSLDEAKRLVVAKAKELYNL